MSELRNTEEKGIDKQGWIRTATAVAALSAAFYLLKGGYESHVSNVDIHKTTGELSQIFVTRQEYNVTFIQLNENIKDLKASVSRLSDKIDKINEEKK